VLAASTAAAAPPPPPPGGPPGSEVSILPPPPVLTPTPVAPVLTPTPVAPELRPVSPTGGGQGVQPAPKPVATPFSRLAGTRFKRHSATRIGLSFVCDSPFTATVTLATGQRLKRHSDCASRAAALNFEFGSRLARQVRQRGRLSATLTVRVGAQPPARLKLTVTRARVTVRAAAASRAMLAADDTWAFDQVKLVCGDIYSGNLNILTVTLHTSDFSTRWVYWKVWMHTYWDDPHGVVKGWYWRNPAGWEPAASPLYPEASYGMPFRINGIGIVDLSQDGGGVIIWSPWTWPENWGLGYNMYARAFLQLYVWDGAAWVSQVHPVQTTGSPTDAPGYCFNP
jgi:hypothetical protein